MDLATADTRLPPGVILDGEAVVYITDDQDGARTSFEAAQSRALLPPPRPGGLRPPPPSGIY